MQYYSTVILYCYCYWLELEYDMHVRVYVAILSMYVAARAGCTVQIEVQLYSYSSAEPCRMDRGSTMSFTPQHFSIKNFSDKVHTTTTLPAHDGLLLLLVLDHSHPLLLLLILSYVHHVIRIPPAPWPPRTL